MSWATRIGLGLGATWAGLGCLALLGLWGATDAQFVGYTLIVAAVPIGLLCELIRVPPGFLFRVRDGWPILTWSGVVLVYFIPALALFRLLTRGDVARRGGAAG